MTLIEELKRFESLSPLGAGWWVNRSVTPKYTFTTFVVEVRPPELLARITIRGEFSEAMAKSLMDFVGGIESSMSISKPLVIHPVRTGPFTEVCVINSECHDAFRAFKGELHGRTLVVFPSYRCEFFGDETPHIIRLLRDDLVDTVNWKRSPSPKIAARYENYTNDQGSEGDKLGLASFETIQSALKDLWRCNGFVEIENYRHQAAKIESSEAGFIIHSNNNEIKKDLNGVLSWAQTFVF
jgi:hypothetical protein